MTDSLCGSVGFDSDGSQCHCTKQDGHEGEHRDSVADLAWNNFEPIYNDFGRVISRPERFQHLPEESASLKLSDLYPS